MNTDPKILSEQYIRGRIYSFVRFKKYLQEFVIFFAKNFNTIKMIL